MVSLQDFKQKLKAEDSAAIVQSCFIEGQSEKVTPAQKSRISEEVRKSYNLGSTDLRIYITGSAHLGFSLVAKPKLNLSRYRPFDANSDIDCAVVSARLFTILWREVSRHAHSLSPWPNPVNGMGNYMIYGWLRPDKFPAGLYHCQQWWDCFKSLTQARVAGNHKVAGGLFYSTDHLTQYLERSVKECQVLEQL